MLSQEEKEAEREALVGARKACDRASKYEHDLFRLQEIESSDVTWREASCYFHELVFQRIRRLKKNYFLCFVNSSGDLTHLSQPLKLNFS